MFIFNFLEINIIDTTEHFHVRAVQSVVLIQYVID